MVSGNGKPFPEQPALHSNPQTRHRAALLTQPANFARALEEAKRDPKKTLLGIANGIPSVFVSQLLASARPDFVWIDLEHAVFNRLESFQAVQTIQHHSEGHSMVAVRVTKNDPATLATVLDAGASAIIIPHVETADEVRHTIKEVFYPPIGQRSFSPWTFTPGVSDSSLYEDDSWNTETSNRHVVLVPQIESVKGMENLEEIAALPHIGGLMFGFGDYMLDAGLKPRMGGEPYPEVMAAMVKFGQVAKKHDLAIFGAAMTPEMIPGLVEGGFNAIAVFFDYWGLVQTAAKNLQAGREALANLGASEANGAANGHNGTSKAEEGKEVEVVVASVKAE